LTHPFPEITGFIVNSSQTINSTNSTDVTRAARKAGAKQQLHVSGRFDKNSSDVNNLATNFVKSHSDKDRLSDDLKNVQDVQNEDNQSII